MSHAPTPLTPAPPQGERRRTSTGRRRSSISGGTLATAPPPQSTNTNTNTSAAAAAAAAAMSPSAGVRRRGSISASALEQRGERLSGISSSSAMSPSALASASSSSPSPQQSSRQHTPQHARLPSRDFAEMPTSNYVFPTTQPEEEEESSPPAESPRIALSTQRYASFRKRDKRRGVTLEHYHLPDELSDNFGVGVLGSDSSGASSQASSPVPVDQHHHRHHHHHHQHHHGHDDDVSSEEGSVYSLNENSPDPFGNNRTSSNKQGTTVADTTTTTVNANATPAAAAVPFDPLCPPPQATTLLLTAETCGGQHPPSRRHSHQQSLQAKAAPMTVAPQEEEIEDAPTAKPLSKESTLVPTASTVGGRKRGVSRAGSKPMVEFIGIVEDDQLATTTGGGGGGGGRRLPRSGSGSDVDELSEANDSTTSSNNKNVATNFQPLWPEFSAKLAASVHAPDAKSFDDLFNAPTAADHLLSMTATHKKHTLGNNVEELDDDDDDDFDEEIDMAKIEEEIEEMMEVPLEAAPVKSQTHLSGTSRSAMSARQVYYFEVKQVLDSTAGTLEGGAPAIVSAAVRANQSPFQPWTEFHQQLVQKQSEDYGPEIEKLLAEGISTPSDIGSVMATPLGYNAAWRMTGVVIHPVSGLLVLNPAVVVPGSVITRSDAAMKMDAFKAVMIRGIPKFERGIQTTLTSYHETSMYFTACRNALLQREQVARMGMTNERSFAVIHMSGLERHYRDVVQWNTNLVKERPRNVLAQYYGQIRERKGQRAMLNKLLDIPTSNGVPLRDVLEPDQTEVFDKGLALAERQVDVSIMFTLPFQQLVKTEEGARNQHVKCYEAWAGSMEHYGSLIGMAFAHRSTTTVMHALRTTTKMDAAIYAAKVATTAVDDDGR